MACEKCSKCQVCGKSTHRDVNEKKKLNRRLNIIEGQIRGIKQMVDDDRYCEDILIQLSAINKAVESLKSSILSSHIENCVAYELQAGNREILSEAMKLLKKIK